MTLTDISTSSIDTLQKLEVELKDLVKSTGLTKELKAEYKNNLVEVRKELQNRYELLLSDCNFFNYINKNFLSLQLDTSVHSVLLSYLPTDKVFIINYKALSYCNCEIRLNETEDVIATKSILLNWLKNNPGKFVELSIEDIKNIRAFKKTAGKTESLVPTENLITTDNDYVIYYTQFIPEKNAEDGIIQAKTEQKSITLKLLDKRPVRYSWFNIYSDIVNEKDKFEFYKEDVKSQLLNEDILKIFKENNGILAFKNTGSLNRILEMPNKYLLVNQKDEECNYNFYARQAACQLRTVIVESSSKYGNVYQILYTI